MKSTYPIDREACLAAWEVLLKVAAAPEKHKDSDFPTREAALVEIKRLKAENYCRHMAIHLLVLNDLFSPPAKGRPRAAYAVVLKNNVIKIEPIVKHKATGRKTGRPMKNTSAEKKSIIENIEGLKRAEAHKDGHMTDKALVTKMIDKLYSHKSAYRKRELIAQHLQELKYIRDTVGIRQKQKIAK